MGRFPELWEEPLWWKLGDCSSVCHVSTCEGHLVPDSEGDSVLFATPLGSVCLWNLFSDLVSFKKELTDRITRLLLTYFGIGSCSPRWPRTPAAA